MSSTEEKSKSNFWEHEMAGVVLIGILLVVVVGVAAATYRQRHPAQPIDSIPTTDHRYQSATSNIRFFIPGGWAVGTSSNVSLPTGFEEPSFVLQKNDSACTIVQAKRDTAAERSRIQISFADRVFSPYGQFDGDWWIPITGNSEGYSFSDHTRQYIPGEFRVSSGVRTYPFLLFMSDGSSVPNNCDDDFNRLLKTVEPYFETVHLDSSSKGMLTTDKVWDDVTYDAPNKSYEHLLFLADGSKEKREVMRIPDGTWWGGFSVFKNKLYAPSSEYHLVGTKTRYNSVIYVLDPFAGTTQQIPGSAKTDSYIASLYIHNGTAYYLAGTSELAICRDSYHDCPADLYSIPLTGGQPTFVAHSSLGGSILGYVESEKAFYISQGWGDAGCSSISINKIIAGTEEQVFSYGGCIEDTEESQTAFKQVEDTIETITAKAGASRVSSKGIRVVNNTLVPINGGSSEDSTFYFYK
jgi:hypothetical protein